eukprot:gene420-690_t
MTTTIPTSSHGSRFAVHDPDADYSSPEEQGRDGLYLGIDLSTQSCKVQVLDTNLRLVGDARVQFDEDFGKKYGVQDGVKRGPGEGQVWSPTPMWAEALDLAMQRLEQKVGKDCLSKVNCISGSGQQHGSVYWSKAGPDILAMLDPNSSKSIDEQLAGAFVVEESPVWMDTSGTAECHAMEKYVGGPEKLSLKTGSRAYERFTAHLISQFLKRGLGKDCSRISLVSSFGASLLCGKIVSIDHSDAAGMNLMNLDANDWDETILEYLSGGGDSNLKEILGAPANAKKIAGTISPYFQKYGFAADCKINYWTGDNPSSVVGLGMLLPGDIAISLGTSDTLLAVVDRQPESSRKPLPFGHLFPHPCLDDKMFLMLCYMNGDVTRRAVRDKYAGGDWDQFTSMLTNTPPGNGNNFGMFFSINEITPPLTNKGNVLATLDGSSFRKVDSFTDEQYVRGVVESRALAMLCHMTSLGFYTPSGRLLMTGGGSKNPAIRQVFADVFRRQVYTLDSADSAATGAAVRAMDACGVLEIDTLTSASEKQEAPTDAGAQAYAELRGPFQKLEDAEMQINARL